MTNRSFRIELATNVFVRCVWNRTNCSADLYFDKPEGHIHAPRGIDDSEDFTDFIVGNEIIHETYTNYKHLRAVVSVLAENEDLPKNIITYTDVAELQRPLENLIKEVWEHTLNANADSDYIKERLILPLAIVSNPYSFEPKPINSASIDKMLTDIQTTLLYKFENMTYSVVGLIQSKLTEL